MSWESGAMIGLIGIAGILIILSVLIKDKVIQVISLILGFYIMTLGMSTTNEIVQLNNATIAIGTSSGYNIMTYSTIFIVGYIIIMFILSTINSVNEKKKREEEE